MGHTDVRRRRLPAIGLGLGLGLALALLTACAGGGADDNAPPPPDRDAVALQMIQLAQAGRAVEAREHLQAYLEAVPDDSAMLYNLVCLDVMLGDTDLALADLDTALTRGYTNFRLMEADPGLAALRDDPRFADLVESHESALRDTVTARTLILVDGYPLGPVPLHGEGAAATAELVYDRESLRLILRVTDPGYDPGRLPWDGGSGVLINLIRPISQDDYESLRFHSVGLGVEDGGPRAWLVALDGEVLESPLPDTTPRIVRQGGETTYEVALDWEIFRPYAPPLDQDMGLNVIYVGAGPVGDRPVLALMPEDRLSWEPMTWRRYAPIGFWTSDRSEPVLRARLYDRLAEHGEVSLEFALWSLSEGPGEYSLSLVDAHGLRLAEPAPRVFAFDAFEGLNFFNESYELGGLPNGTYRLELSLDGPDGVPLTYAETFARFDETTLEALNERIYRMGTPESEILRYRLFQLARSLDRRHPQSDPTDLLETYARVSAQVDVCAAGGTCLPDSGLVRGGFAVDRMTERLCALYLPPGHRDLASPRLLVVVPPRPGVEMELAAALGAALADRPDVIVAVPQSHGDSGLALAPASEQTELAVHWARDLVGAVDVTLVGLGNGADAALAMSLDSPELVDRVWLEGDRLLSAGGRGSQDGMAEFFAGRVNALPYLLTGRPNPTGWPTQLASSMQKRGFAVETLGLGTPADDVSWVAARVERSTD